MVLICNNNYLFFPYSSIVIICFSNVLPRGEYVNLACSIILLWSNENVLWPIRYSYLSFFLDENANIFAASLLITYCSFSSLVLSWIVMINFYIVSKRFFLKHEELSDGRVVSITKKIWFCSRVFIKIHKVLKVNIRWKIKWNLMKLSFVWNFDNEIVCWI